MRLFNIIELAKQYVVKEALIMKKIISLLLLLACICGVTGCQNDTVSNAKINYGTSSIYSEEDMDEAIEVIKDEFNTGEWREFELQSISYSSDEECDPDNLGWLRELAEANHVAEDFTQCIKFETDFHTSANAPGQWNEDTDYNDYQWWLVRTDDGEWQLLSWGYC